MRTKFNNAYNVFLCEMASFPPLLTGLKKRIYFSIDPKTKHNHVRFKYEIEPDNLVPFIIRTGSTNNIAIELVDPKNQYHKKITANELTDITKFIQMNIVPIIQHWNNKISSYELGQIIKGLK